MGKARLVVASLVVVVAVAAVVVWRVVSDVTAKPACVVGPHSHVSQDDPANFVLTPEQAGNAATIAAVAQRMGMPHHAVTVALATALQESGLSNLSGGDRDSLGLFQQRPSQGWGTSEQIMDPVYASSAFYERLRKVNGWQELPVTVVAQRVQHSANPDAYGAWEKESRALAMALTGETIAAFTCHDLTITAPKVELPELAADELGVHELAKRYPEARGWAVSTWLVAHAPRLGVDRVTFDGYTWTADSGGWEQTGPGDGHFAVRTVTRSSG